MSRARRVTWPQAVVVAAAGLVWCASAKAQGGPAAAAVCLDQGESDAALPARLCGNLTIWLGSSGRWSVAPVDQALATGGDFDPIVAIREATELLESARTEYGVGDRKKGLKLHEQAAEAFIALDPWLTDRDALATALLDLMAAQMALLKPRDLWQADQTAVRLLNFVPAVRETWKQKVRPGPQYDRLAEVAGRMTDERGGMEVSCSADPCEVFVDGAFAGVTPLVLGDIAAGEHLIRVRRTGFVPTSRVVAVAPDGREPQRFDLERAQGATAWSQIVERLPAEVGLPRAGDALGDLRALLVVDQVVALRVLPADDQGESVIEAYLYDLRSDQLLGAVDMPVKFTPGTDYGELVATLMQELLAAQERALAAAEGGGDDVDSTSFLNTWWFWTGVGAAVLIGGGVGVWLALDEDAPTAPAGPGPDPNAGTIRLRF